MSSLDRFLTTRTPAWARLEALLKKTGRRANVRALSGPELHELARLYPAVAVDVARARSLEADERVQRRVNQLAIAAHGLLYRRPASRPLRAVGRFFRREYPRLFRRLWPYWTLVTVLIFVSGLGAYVSTQLRPSTAHLLVPMDIEGRDMRPGTSADDISAPFHNMANVRPMLASGIISNNISVAFNAFALGITAGIGTLYVVIFHGMFFGGLTGHFANYGLAGDLWAFIAPHGVLEIMAVLIAAGSGLRLGLSLAIPGRLTRLASLRAGAKEAALLVLGTVPMFVIAGVIEGFVTPSQIGSAPRLLIGFAAGGLVLAYLLFGGRKTKETEGNAARARAAASP